jgi:hypothetical protein
MICQERSGFLFAHACDRTAVWTCARCGKSICYEHARPAEDGYTCITCLRTSPPPQSGDKPQQTEDDPYFYGGTGAYYDADDYDAFDAGASGTDDESQGDSFGAS